MRETVSPLDAERSRWRPEFPSILAAGPRELALREVAARTTAAADAATLRQRFPTLFGSPALSLEPGPGLGDPRPLAVGVVLSGGQAPGGHDVIAGLFDGLREIHPGSRVVGFLDGPRGVVEGRQRPLADEEIDRHRCMGGFDLIGSGRDKIETEEQLERARATLLGLKLDGLVIVGGDDSNTNAATLAEWMASRADRISVLGVPKTIDGDLKGHGIEVSFGFDTATRVYGSLIGNLCRDVSSAKKYWHFIRLMGRSASHVTLECALATRPNLALVAEEVRALGWGLEQVVDHVARVIRARAERGRRYGVCLVPEGLVEFMPDVSALIVELNRLLAGDKAELSAADADRREQKIGESLSPASRQVFSALPPRIRRQLLIDRDSHGNVQVSRIDTEQLLIELVRARLGGRLDALSHFFGYEGRSANPTNFDVCYTRALGRVAALLVAGARTGYLCAVGNLASEPERWTAGAVPLTSLMQLEERKGRTVPVIAKALVSTGDAAFRAFAERRADWELHDAYRYPGAIQYFGPRAVTSRPPHTLLLEQTGDDATPAWAL